MDRSDSHDSADIRLGVIEELPKMGSGKIDFRTTTEMVRDVLHHRGHK